LSNNAALFAAETIRSQKIGDDVVIVAGVKGDVIAPGFNDGTHDIERLVAIEGRHLDGDDVLNFSEATPEGIRQRATSDAGLKVEADNGDGFGNGAAMRDELVFRGGAHGAEAEESGVVAVLFQNVGFIHSLLCLSADAADANERAWGAVHFFGR
jgi:hypothetical protein